MRYLKPPTTVLFSPAANQFALSGYARIDLRLDEKDQNKVFVLEANPNCQLALGEDLADSAVRAGLPYKHLLQRILSLGLRFHAERVQR